VRQLSKGRRPNRHDGQFLRRSLRPGYVPRDVPANSRVINVLNDAVATLFFYCTLCTAVGPVASVGLFLAPIPTIKDVMNAGTIGGLPMLPYSFMASNAFVWCTYGILKNQPPLWSCNAIGFVFAMYYCFQFALHVPARTKYRLNASTPTLPGTIKHHFIGISFVFAITTLIAGLRPFGTYSADVIGNIAVLFCILMFASPLSVIQLVIRTKSAGIIPLPFTVVSCLNCFCWAVYGFFALNDINVWLPNSLGLTFGVIQVILKIVFCGRDNKEIDIDEEGMELEP
jgi:solute carrier family 50 (sugar transporter)